MNAKIKSFLAIFGAFFLLLSTQASAETTSSEFAEAKALIDQKVSCSQLSTAQLEKVGDYYMEQMHPGDAHEQMEKIMGGEGSESLRQAHIFMAKRWYCGDAAGYGMMGMMMGSGFLPNMMGGAGRLGNNSNFNSMMGYNFGYGYGGIWMSVIWILSVVLIVAGIAALIKYLTKK